MIASSLFLRVDRLEGRLCRRANAIAQRRALRAMFRTVSRLGDGMFWYLLMLSMPLWMGRPGVKAGAVMLATGAAGLATYKLLKHRLVRERPFIGLIGIECAMPPLDRYSFPSGHTLHAVLFTTMAVSFVPALALVLLPFALLVAMSRVVLGLHYPSDVLVGAGLGYGLALAGLAVFY